VKKAIGLLLLAVGALVSGSALVLGGSEVSQARENDEPSVLLSPLLEQDGYPAYQCFDLTGRDDDEKEENEESEENGDGDHLQVGLVTENFGLDVVTVKDLALVCELGLIYPDSGGNSGEVETVRILACYVIEHGDNPDDPVILSPYEEPATVDAAVIYEDAVVVKKAQYLCEEGTKTLVNGRNSATVVSEPYGEITGRVWECFSVERGDEGNEEVTLVTENFGSDRVEIKDLSLLCEFAEKVLENGQGGYDPVCITEGCLPEEGDEFLACFEIDDGEDHEVRVEIETDNFGTENVRIDKAKVMCVSVLKERPFQVID
jgi:hypothetical protein